MSLPNLVCRSESNIIIFAGITELLLSAEQRSSIPATIDPVFSGLKGELTSLCASRSLQVFVAPPLFRPRPAWYNQSLPWIANQWSLAMARDQPVNLHLLPSPLNQELAPDGIHLTPVAGLHYVIHIFDQSVSGLASLGVPPDQQLAPLHEAVRSQDDRITYLENKHLFLDHRVNLKTAEDAEFHDMLRNKNDEDWFNITGLPRLSSKLDNRGWQVEAKRQIRDVLRQVLQLNKVNISFEILVVVNPIKWRTTGPTIYNVRLSSVESCRRIRDLYSGFFRHSNPIKLPSNLKGVKLRNKITLNTKIRLAIMRQLGEHYIGSNPGSSYKVRGYDPRPLLVLTPPSSDPSSRMRSLIFTDAVSTVRAHFNDEDLIQIFMSVGTSNRGRLRALFVVLSDDDHDRCLELVKKFHQDRRQDQPKGGRGGKSGSGAATTITQPQTHSAFVSGPGTGMETEGRRQPLSFSMLRQPAPPPPPSPSGSLDNKTGKSVSHSGHRAGKTSRTAPLKRSHRSSSSSPPRSRPSRPSKHRKKRSRRAPTPSSSESDSSSSSSDSSGSSDSGSSGASTDSRSKKGHEKAKKGHSKAKK